jgi:HK97 gp10 family phage protein
LDQFTSFLGSKDAQVNQAVSQVAGSIGDEAKTVLQAELSHTGRSSPGEPPGMITGALEESVAVSIDTDSDITSVTISVLAPYAPFLERGTYKMAPRPFFERVIESYLVKWVGDWQDAINAVLGE